MKVFVLSQEGKPLMPTTPRRAKLWLKARQARVVRQEPFTIRLRFATREYVQEVVVGVDTGSKVVGIAATANGAVVLQSEVHLRDDITEKMTTTPVSTPATGPQDTLSGSPLCQSPPQSRMAYPLRALQSRGNCQGSAFRGLLAAGQTDHSGSRQF